MSPADPEPQSGRCVPERRFRGEKRKRFHELGFRNGRRRRLPLSAVIKTFLRLFGLFQIGRREVMKLSVVRNDVCLRSLPEPLDGLRILHLSDFHFDLVPELADVVAGLLEEVACDVCVMTGDYRESLTMTGERGVHLAAGIAERYVGQVPVYACLGNHDLWHDQEILEKAGIRMLVNEHAVYERDGARLYFCGVDDPGYHRTDDFAAAYEGVPEGACSVALVHSPCAYARAAAAGASLMLCGHTHGGQICLPGGIPILSHSKCPRRMIAGTWKYGSMQGYTSRGIGANAVPVRFFCRGEIVIHTLHKKV